MTRRIVVLFAGLTLWLLAVETPAQAEAVDRVDFGRDIRPILVDACFTCHGPDENTREAGLRLDQQESAFAETDSGSRAIVPGDPDACELIARITSDDESMLMPPVETDKVLSAEEIALLKRWIQQGADWDQHWAFVPPRQPEVPEVRHDTWPRNEVDRFVLARLERDGILPTIDAARTTQLRRVTFDLTGLPPTPQHVAEFLRDKGAGAYERVVDRLLGSPQFGEHMARFWLDAARYGDTHGLHLDNYREIWPYRDWVVDAFNRNLPFDEFVIEQLAGDLLPDATDDQVIATGFIRCNVTTNEGGSITEEVYVRNVVDSVVTVGTVFMGLTLECTRCHDHKYDPLTMNDFYSFFAYFNSLDGDPLDGNRKDHAPVLRVPTPNQRQQLQAIDADIRAIQLRLSEPWPELDDEQREWEQTELAKAALPEPSESPQIGLGQWHVVGPFPDVHRYLFGREHGPEGHPIDLEQTFESAAGETFSWQARPEWADGEIHTDFAGDMAANFIVRTISSPVDCTINISIGTDDAVKIFLNGKEVFANDVTRGVAADQDELQLNLRSGDNTLLMKLINYGGQTGFYFRSDAQAAALPPEISDIVTLSAGKRSSNQQASLRAFFRLTISDSAEVAKLKERTKSVRKERAEIERNVATTLIWREKAKPVPAYLLKRGEYDSKSDERPRATPAFLPSMPEGLPDDRLGLAHWLVDGQHPLTSRITVNRMWQQVFGTGLVKTSDNFGTRGDRPSHPELLDWLAVQFVNEGWDVKTMMKRLVSSSTYRQSSRVTSETLQLDSENRLLSRGPRFRLDAEMLRDQALAVSGLLVTTRGGPSVKPPQPDGLWLAVGYTGSNTVRFAPDKETDKIHRRTLYTFVKRTSPPPQMSTFDGPSRESCSVRRERTNTPLQALLLFNDPQFFEAAQMLASRAIEEADNTDEARLRYMFQLCTGRMPTHEELAELLDGYREDLRHFEQDTEATKEINASNKAIRADEAPELAAWTMVANLLLNLDEVVTKN